MAAIIDINNFFNNNVLDRKYCQNTHQTVFLMIGAISKYKTPHKEQTVPLT